MMKKVIFVFPSLVSILLVITIIIFITSSQGIAQIPINNLTAWYKADSVIITNGKVSQWNDVSGNGFHFTQTNETRRPLQIDQQIGNKPVIRFDGTMFMKSNFGQVYSQPNTIIMVHSLTKGYMIDGFDGVNRHFIDDNLGNKPLRMYAGAVFQLTNAQPIPFGYSLYSYVFNTTNSKAYQNGVLINTGNPGTAGLSGFTVGSHTAQNFTWFTGDIAEIILYNSELTDNERNQVEQYLMNKYTPLFSLGNDININYGFCGTTLSIPNGFNNIIWSTGETAQSIIVNKSGSYWVQATDYFGRTHLDTIQVSYPQKPFIVSSSNVFCYNSTYKLYLNGFGSQNGYTVEWFNNSQTDTLLVQNYSGNIWAKVTDNQGCIAFSDTLLIILDSTAINTGFIASDTTLCAGNPISPLVPEIMSFSYLWNTGSNQPQIVVNQTGWYYVTITSENQCQGKDSIYVNISGQAPLVSFDVPDICQGDTLQITNNTVSPDGSLINQWIWVLNSTDTFYIQNPLIHLQNPGSYTLSLKAVTVNGCQNTSSRTIQVYPIPQADIISPSISCLGKTVQFIANNISGDIASWDWNFGDTYTSANQNPNHVYTDTGYYQVSLHATTQYGCSLIKNTEIIIIPAVEIITDLSLVFPPDNHVSTGNTIHFQWETNNENIQFYIIDVSLDSLFQAVIFSKPVTVNRTKATIANTKTAFWRVRAYNICNDSIVSDTFRLNIFSPDQINNMVFWVATDTGVQVVNGKILQWDDISGNNYNLLQNTELRQPVFINNLIGDKPVARFNGTQYMKSNFGQVYQQPNTIFMVHSMQSGYMIDGYDGTNRHFVDDNLGNKPLRLYAGAAFQVPNAQQIPFGHTLFTYIFNNANSKVYQNGIFLNMGNPGSMGLGGFTVGSHNSQSFSWFTGDIAEIILFNSELSDNERAMVENYLMDKYGPKVDLGSDFTINYGFEPVTISATNFYRSYLWSTSETTSSIQINTSGTYSVTVTDIFGRTSSDEIIVTYPEFYVPADTTICDGDTLQWSPDLRGPYFYLWNNGLLTPSAAFTQEGDYFVRITDTLGNSVISDTLHLLIDLYPQTATLGPDSSMCAGNKLKLLSGASETALYQWDDGSVLPYITVNSPGEYSVTVTNNRGCTAVDTINIDIHGIAPVAEFIADTACLNNPTHFTNLSLSPDGSLITQNIWNFGVNASSTLSNPEFVYPGPGEFEVILRILTQNNCAEEIIHTVKVYDNPKPRFSPQQGCTGTDIQFSSQSTSNDGSITSLTWIFNDTIFVVTNQPAFFYEQSGNYSIGLVAVSEFGCRDTLKKMINIRPGPFIGFENSPACIGEPVYFTGRAQTFLNTRAEFYWNVNGIAAAQISNPVFTFDTSASYLIQLTVVQPINNCSSHTEKVIQVYNKPVAAIASDQACQGEMVIISDTSVQGDNTITDFDYYIENKGYYHYRNPQVVFNDTGNYSIHLTISDAAGCADTAFQIFTVHPKPEPSFNFSPRLGVIPQQVQFINNSLHAETVVWDFGDGFVSNVYNPVHTYTDSGFFQINLTAYSEYGCINSSAATIKVLLPILEIEVRKVDVKFSGLFMEVSATLANFGTVEVNNMDLELQTSDGKLLKENWRGNFRSGGSFVYTFSTHLAYTELTKPQFICVTAIPYTLHDELNTQNNMNCKTFSDGFTMYNMYPNPTSGDVNIEFNLPYETAVNIDFVNFMGETAYAFATPPLPKGFNRVIFDSRQLGLGLFICRVSFKDKQVSKRFWVTYGIR